MKSYKGKAIYNPSGKAGEYSYWACNFYKGCSGMCSYCYCKKGVLAKTLGGDKPVLKSCFRNEGHAKDVFEKEMWQNREELRKHGLFFSFTTDPMLFETIHLTVFALTCCLCAEIPVKILTKRADWVDLLIEHLDKEFKDFDNIKQLIAFGFTLTGHDELEPGCSTNQQRIDLMEKLHDSGFKTFASIEPIIDFKSSFEMISQTVRFCDHYKIGILAGDKYLRSRVNEFITDVEYTLDVEHKTVYWKESILKQSTYCKELHRPCSVDRQYQP